jgi:Rad3-related DNA helicase
MRATGLIMAEWRRTGWNGITHPIAIQRIGAWLKVVKPAWRAYSRTQRHGAWYYYANQVDALLYLEQSNSGKRYVHVSMCRLTAELCRLIEETARSVWLTGATVRQVEKVLEELEITAKERRYE